MGAPSRAAMSNPDDLPSKKYVTILTGAAHWTTYYWGPHIEWLTL